MNNLLISNISKLFNNIYVYYTNEHDFTLCIKLSNSFIKNILDKKNNDIIFTHYNAHKIINTISLDIKKDIQMNAKFLLWRNFMKIIINSHNNDHTIFKKTILNILIVLVIEQNLSLTDNDIIKIINTDNLYKRFNNRINGAFYTWQNKIQIEQIEQNQINQNQIEQNQIEQNQIEQNQIEQNQIEQNQINQNQIYQFYQIDQNQFDKIYQNYQHKIYQIQINQIYQIQIYKILIPITNL